MCRTYMPWCLSVWLKASLPSKVHGVISCLEALSIIPALPQLLLLFITHFYYDFPVSYPVLRQQMVEYNIDINLV